MIFEQLLGEMYAYYAVHLLTHLYRTRGSLASYIPSAITVVIPMIIQKNFRSVLKSSNLIVAGKTLFVIMPCKAHTNLKSGVT